MKAFIIFLLTICCQPSHAQTAADYQTIKLGNAAECTAAEPVIREAYTYVLSTPFQKDDLRRVQSLSLIIRWMTATPDFSFALDETASKLMKGNEDLISLYMTAMAKYCLENRAASKDLKLVKINAVTYLLNYCENEKNDMKMTKPLRRLSEAKAKGELEQAL